MYMLKTPRFWVALCCILLALTFIGRQASAQSPSGAIITYDMLTRSQARQPDTTRAPEKRLLPARSRVDTPRRVDTLHLVATDTFRVARTDTVIVFMPAPAEAAAPVKPVAQKAAPAAYAPPSVSGMLQVQLTGGDSLLRATYRIRRAEVKVTSDLGRRAQAVVMVDAAKALGLNTASAQPAVAQSSRVLQDAYIVLVTRFLQLDAGQHRLPIGYEGGQGSSNLETIDRALFQSDRSRGGALGDVRDLGVTARGSLRQVEYRVGVFNGSGESMNETDRNVGKAIVGQLVIRPRFIKGLRIGASGVTSGAPTGDKPARDRVGADLVLVRSRASLQAEVMTGQDGALRRRGFYVLATVSPIAGVKLVGRYDTFDPDISAEATSANVLERDYLAGVTWAPAGMRLRLHTAVVHKTFTNRVTPSTTQLLTQLQAAW